MREIVFLRISQLYLFECAVLLYNQCAPMHYAKVVKTGFEVVNFNKLILHQFSTKISQIFNDSVKTSKYLTK